MPTALSSSSARVARLLLRDVVVEQDRLDRAARRSCAPGSATSSGPGRSSRSRCRGCSRSRLAVASSRSSPLNSASPARDRVRLRLFSPMIVRQVTLLPEPDSPTMPSVLPFSTEKLTPSTALTMPSSVRKCVSQVADLEKRHRSSLGQPDPRVDPGVEEVDDQVEDDDRERREHDDALRSIGRSKFVDRYRSPSCPRPGRL